MKKVCIFCRKSKDETEFNDEHIFPAAIGGKYIINSVCSNCNKTLGKNIDNPFSKFKPILQLRRKYKIGREVKEGGQRNIGNPYSGKFLGADGHEYYCTVDNDGNPIRNMVPKYEVFQTEDDGPIGKLSLSAKDFTSEEDVIKMFAKFISNHHHSKRACNNYLCFSIILMVSAIPKSYPLIAISLAI